MLRGRFAQQGTFAVVAAFTVMTDLNAASLEDITAAGVSTRLAQQLVLWGPFRVWEDLLWIGDVDEQVLQDLMDKGFGLGSLNDKTWAAPRRFALSASAAA